MRIETQVNNKGELLMVVPKCAPAGVISQLRRNLKIKFEYFSNSNNLVFVVGD